MEIGAVLITAGLGDAPALSSGGVTTAQRMIASLKKAGATVIALVTGPEDKKFEKQLAQSGVFFLHSLSPDDERASLELGLAYLRKKCREVFCLRANRPLLDPETLIRMRSTSGNPVAPVCNGKQGRILLVRTPFPEIHSLEHTAVEKLLNVNDRGILLTAEEAEGLTDAIAEHDRKLTRPVLDLSIARGKPLVDGKLVTLLQLIRETQSVRNACGQMQISYSAAWNLLNTVEDALGYPLVRRNKGGPSGAGTLLTEKGHRFLLAYEQFESEARKQIQQLYDEYMRNIL